MQTSHFCVQICTDLGQPKRRTKLQDLLAVHLSYSGCKLAEDAISHSGLKQQQQMPSVALTSVQELGYHGSFTFMKFVEFRIMQYI